MPTDIETILKLQVPVIVQVGRRRMPLDDILALGPGAIVDLDRSSEEELDLLVNNKIIGRGVAVKVGENFGIRITRVDETSRRIHALGQSTT